MSSFIIECPACHAYAEGQTGFFARKQIKCICGNTIQVKTDSLVARVCQGCGNTVAYDQRLGEKAVCPVCHKQIAPAESMRVRTEIACQMCGCEFSVNANETSAVCPLCAGVNDVRKALLAKEQKAANKPGLIRFEGGDGALVYRHPATDFAPGSEVLVHETQEAIYFLDGKAKRLTAGRAALETPAGRSTGAYHAVLYFVSLTTRMGVKWGTSSKMRVKDPGSGIVFDVGASGTVNLRVVDSLRLVTKLAGTAGTLQGGQLFGDADALNFRAMIGTMAKDDIAQIIAEEKYDLLELDAHLKHISSEVGAMISDALEEYGLAITEFFVTNVLMPEGDPNFARMRQQHADRVLKLREEENLRQEAIAKHSRVAVTAQTDAQMKAIDAQGEATVMRIKAEAEAEAFRLRARAEADEMAMKGYSYKDDTERQAILGIIQNPGVMANPGAVGQAVSQVAQVNASLGGMARGYTAASPLPAGQWTCACGQAGNDGNFCKSCGAPKPQATWTCACGQAGNDGNFCKACGAPKPQPTWTCACGQVNDAKFCKNCGQKRPGA